MNKLCTSERRKRKYTKVAAEFWDVGKRDCIKDIKKKCISRQNLNNAAIETDKNNEVTASSQKKRQRRHCQNGAKKNKTKKK